MPLRSPELDEGPRGVLSDCTSVSVLAVFTAFTSIVPNSMLLTLLAFSQPSEVHAGLGCCVAIDCPVLTIGLRFCHAFTGSNQAYRAISTSQLKALPLLHLWPIDVVVFHGSQGRPCFEGGFPLRCLQRLSCPNIATQHYRWHDNWSTSGSFTPVLSY